MKVVVRKAANDDVPRILDILLQVNNVHADGRPDIFKKGGRKYTREQLAVLMEDESRPIFVAADEAGEVLGYGFCVIIDTAENSNLHPRRELYIDDLCVDKKYRRRGIGQMIFDHILAYAREIGSYHLTLNVWACNPAAMRFYERQGMAVLKKEMEILL